MLSRRVITTNLRPNLPFTRKRSSNSTTGSDINIKKIYHLSKQLSLRDIPFLNSLIVMSISNLSSSERRKLIESSRALASGAVSSSVIKRGGSIKKKQKGGNYTKTIIYIATLMLMIVLIKYSDAAQTQKKINNQIFEPITPNTKKDTMLTSEQMINIRNMLANERWTVTPTTEFERLSQKIYTDLKTPEKNFDPQEYIGPRIKTIFGIKLYNKDGSATVEWTEFKDGLSGRYGVAVIPYTHDEYLDLITDFTINVMPLNAGVTRSDVKKYLREQTIAQNTKDYKYDLSDVQEYKQNLVATIFAKAFSEGTHSNTKTITFDKNDDLQQNATDTAYQNTTDTAQQNTTTTTQEIANTNTPILSYLWETIIAVAVIAATSAVAVTKNRKTTANAAPVERRDTSPDFAGTEDILESIKKNEADKIMKFDKRVKDIKTNWGRGPSQPNISQSIYDSKHKLDEAKEKQAVQVSNQSKGVLPHGLRASSTSKPRKNP